jgi:hypothetical protein
LPEYFEVRQCTPLVKKHALVRSSKTRDCYISVACHQLQIFTYNIASAVNMEEQICNKNLTVTDFSCMEEQLRRGFYFMEIHDINMKTVVARSDEKAFL